MSTTKIQVGTLCWLTTFIVIMLSMPSVAQEQEMRTVVYMLEHTGNSKLVEDFIAMVRNTISRIPVRDPYSQQIYVKHEGEIPQPNNEYDAQDTWSKSKGALELIDGHAYGYEKVSDIVSCRIYLGNLTGDIEQRYFYIDFIFNKENVRKPWDALTLITLYAMAMHAKNELHKPGDAATYLSAAWEVGRDVTDEALLKGGIAKLKKAIEKELQKAKQGSSNVGG